MSRITIQNGNISKKEKSEIKKLTDALLNRLPNVAGVSIELLYVQNNRKPEGMDK